eukprot:CFRG7564T1
MPSDTNPVSEENISERIYNKLATLSSEPEPELAFGTGDAKKVQRNGGESDEFDYDYEGEEEEYDDEEVVEMSEAELISMLDAERDPLSVCQKLFVDCFEDKLNIEGNLCVLTASQIKELHDEGYITMSLVNNYVAEARKEILELISTKQIELCPAGHQIEHGTAEEESVTEDNCYNFDSRARGDSVAFLHVDQEPVLQSSNLCQLIHTFKGIQKDLTTVMNLKHESAEYQLALYPGKGTHYQKHRDALPDDGSEYYQRRITIICYLNTEWQEQDGGHLRVFKPPMTGGGSIDTAPEAGRVIIFLSGAMDHEVMPSFADRLALTAWCQ